jgi:hypothetical protein
MKGFPIDQKRTNTAQFSFVPMRMTFVEDLGSDHIEDGISQKFQPLVMKGRVAAMGQGLPEQSGIPESIT